MLPLPMPLWFAGLLGLVQGLTEFIPVSSNAHLRLVSTLVGQKDAGAGFTAVLQLGSLVAVIAYFAKDLLGMASHLARPGSPEGRLAWQIAAATLPIVVLGLVLREQIKDDTRSLYLICGTWIVVGVVMYVVDQRAATSSATKSIMGLTWTDVMIIGGAQCFALLPGVSRSGATICMALALGLTRSDAARFSFLLAIPAVAGAGILESREVFKNYGLPPIFVGIAVATVTSYAAIAWLMKWLGSHQLAGFAIYRIVAGIALLGALLAGWLPAL